MGRATRRRPRPTGLNGGVFQGHLLIPAEGHLSPSLKIRRLTATVTILGGRALAAPGPGLDVSLPALMGFLWYARRTPYLMLSASLILIGRSCAILGTAAQTKAPKKATQPERSTGRCRSTATRSATSAFFFSQLLGLGSAEELRHSELPSPSSLSVLGIVLGIGLVVLGEAYWLAA